MISKLSVFIIAIIAVIGLDATCPDLVNNKIVSSTYPIEKTTINVKTDPTPPPTTTPPSPPTPV
jgi:hypothetical protein